MNTKSLLIIYMGILIIMLFLLLISHKKNKKYYAHLDKKKHQLLFLYPAAGVVYSFLKKASLIKTKNSIVQKLKRLHVKENVAEEVFLYYLKKISVVLGIVLMTCILGALFVFSHMVSKNISAVNRNEHGKGSAYYNLNVNYEGKSENIELSVDEVKFNEDEIHTIFEENIDDIEKIMLNNNSDRENVSTPLNLISEYNGISIFWDIDRTDVIDFNGEIEDVSIDNPVVKLYANLSIDDVSEIFVIPIKVTEQKKTEKELLLNDIVKKIEENNSIYEPVVNLPDEALGKDISFKKSEDHNEHIFIIIGLLAVLLMILGYDRKIDKEINIRNDEMLLDFSDIVSKLNLLYDAGLSINKAFERIVEEHEKKEKDKSHFAYKEMKMTLEKIKNGMSEREAYAEFGKRCGLHPYIKLGNLLEQNLNKGTKGLKSILKSESKEALEEKKKIARKKGEEASTKLLLPMIMMLVVVIVIITVPALMTIRL